MPILTYNYIFDHDNRHWLEHRSAVFFIGYKYIKYLPWCINICTQFLYYDSKVCGIPVGSLALPLKIKT